MTISDFCKKWGISTTKYAELEAHMIEVVVAADLDRRRQQAVKNMQQAIESLEEGQSIACDNLKKISGLTSRTDAAFIRRWAQNHPSLDKKDDTPEDDDPFSHGGYQKDKD